MTLGNNSHNTPTGNVRLAKLKAKSCTFAEGTKEGSPDSDGGAPFVQYNDTKILAKSRSISHIGKEGQGTPAIKREREATPVGLEPSGTDTEASPESSARFFFARSPAPGYANTPYLPRQRVNRELTPDSSSDAEETEPLAESSSDASKRLLFHKKDASPSKSRRTLTQSASALANQPALARSGASQVWRSRRVMTQRVDNSSMDPQAIYPHKACIHVAGLPGYRSDFELEAALKAEFEKYGPCFIKVRRDMSEKKFAFVQFAIVEHAQKALRLGNDPKHPTFILGWACRVEEARGNMEFVVSKRNGGRITAGETTGAAMRCW